MERTSKNSQKCGLYLTQPCLRTLSDASTTETFASSVCQRMALKMRASDSESSWFFSLGIVGTLLSGRPGPRIWPQTDRWWIRKGVWCKSSTNMYLEACVIPANCRFLTACPRTQQNRGYTLLGCVWFRKTSWKSSYGSHENAVAGRESSRPNPQKSTIVLLCAPAVGIPFRCYHHWCRC